MPPTATEVNARLHKAIDEKGNVMLIKLFFHLNE